MIGCNGIVQRLPYRSAARRNFKALSCVNSNENVTEWKLLVQMIMLPGCPLPSGSE